MPSGTFENKNVDKFFHISRHAELVFVKDRDVVAFWPEILMRDSTLSAGSPQTAMKICRDSTQSFTQYETASADDQVKAQQRTLVWARMCGDEIVGGLRWVPYITSHDVDANTNIKPLREVYAPRVAYDRASNTISLWFWANFKEEYTGNDYDEGQLVPTLVDEFNNYVTDGTVKCKRRLCYAIGEFYHVYVDGGFVSGAPPGTMTEGASWDLVPVFAQPRVLNYGDVPSEGGIVVDGWYMPSGATGSATGPQGATGAAGPILGWCVDGIVYDARAGDDFDIVVDNYDIYEIGETIAVTINGESAVGKITAKFLAQGDTYKCVTVKLLSLIHI